MEFLIITGLSGAGKSRAADVLEDIGYYCVDNMPAVLMPRFAEFCAAGGGKYDKVALVTDVREKGSFEELIKTIEELRGMDCGCRVLFMDADKKTLVRRYKESRRKHPLYTKGESVETSIDRENELLKPVREMADYTVDTTGLTLGMLQKKIKKILAPEAEVSVIEINVMSFGYKYGIPLDADLVFDARFLPNPFYVEELRPLSGLDSPVMEYVFSYQQTREFMTKVEDMVEYLIPLYAEEGKQTLTIAVGCTGGRHRSVAIASALNAHLLSEGVSTVLINRDIDK